MVTPPRQPRRPAPRLVAGRVLARRRPSVGQTATPSSPSRWIWFALGAMVLAILALVMLDLLLLLQIQRITALPGEALGRGADQIARLRGETFQYNLALDQRIPIQTDVPIQRLLTVPISTTLPVNTNVTVPIDLPFGGRWNAVVPIRATVPISLTVQTPISDTLRVDTVVPVRADVPIVIRLDETPLKRYLEELEQTLRDLR